MLRNGAGRILTAGHCAPQGNPAWVRTGVGATVTSNSASVAVRNNWDSLLIDPTPSPATNGRVYWGGLNTSTVIGVGGAAGPSIGERVCVSGSNTPATGANCNRAEIDGLLDHFCSASQVTGAWCPAFQVESRDNDPIGGSGDSGAPVYVLRGDDRAGARGIYVASAGDEVACDVMRRWPEDVPRPCDRRINVVRILPLLTEWGVTLEYNSNP